jgi:hypothetical protein
VAADNITVNQSQNGLEVGTPETGSAPTTGDGSFPDLYYVCSSKCPGIGETTALQNWTINGLGLPHVNGISYKCGSIVVDGR